MSIFSNSTAVYHRLVHGMRFDHEPPPRFELLRVRRHQDTEKDREDLCDQLIALVSNFEL